MTMDNNKFILNEKETLQLLTAFFHEALRFLNISKDDYPKITIGFGISDNYS